MKHSESRGILVLGMHRSGTSALARLIVAMGAYGGDDADLLPPHPVDNPAGYFERTDVMRAHDRLLEQAGAAWDRISGFDLDRIDAATRTAIAREIGRAIAALRAHGTPWLIKDPRLSLLLPLWLEQAPAAACVVAVRDPREIAASLVDTHRGVYPTHFLLALWEKYTRTLLGALAGRRALFVAYPALLADPSAEQHRVREALRKLGVDLESEGGAAEHAVDRSLQRSRAPAHAQMTAAQAQLFDWLAGRARAPGAVVVEGFPEAEMPDAVLAEHERAFDDRSRRGHEAATGLLQQHVAEIAASVKQHEHERAGWLSELNARREHNEQLLQAINEAQQGNVSLQQAIADLNAHAGRLQDAVESERAAGAALREGLGQATTELERLRGERSLLLVQIDHAAAERVNLLADAERLRADVERATAAIEQTGSECDVLRGERDVLRGERDAIRIERDALRAVGEQTALELSAHREHADALSKHAEALSRHADALTASVNDMQGSLSWRATAPLRVLGRLTSIPVWPKAERTLWRWYYALPGSAARKRQMIVWLHTHAPWLTRHTVSYQIHTHALAAVADRANPKLRMDAERAAALLARIGTQVRFSIVLLVDAIDLPRLAQVVDSLVRQFYPSWELCIVGSAATPAATKDAMQDLAFRDPRIRVRYHQRSHNTADARNAALRWTKGDYVAFIDADGELARDALLEVARVVHDDHAELVYCDEDTLTADGRHVEPSFKPDFSLDYLLSTNFLGRFCVIGRRSLQAAGAFRSGLDDAQDYDLLLRVSETAPQIAHIAQVLYHRRADAPAPAHSVAAQTALRDALARRGIDGDVEYGRLPGTYRVRRAIAGAPLVSILLPFRDKPDLLRTCVDSILARTRYANFELVGIDNGSAHEETHELMRALAARDERVRFVRHDVPFNYSAIVNYGVTQTRGEHLLMLNNDTEVIGEEWIDALLEHSQRPEVGAVGALLQYPNNSIQHAGVIVGIGGVAGHAHLMIPARDGGYCGRAQVIQNLSAVTFACAMTRRDVFDKVGGLDSVHLIAAYNDIDFCLRLREAGYLIVYTPYSELYHHESASRPHDLHPAQRARYDSEIRYMKERHARFLERGDPYYSPHLSLAQPFLPLLDYADSLPA